MDLDQLRPTLKDVKNLSESAAGPDGTPNILYKHIWDVAAGPFLELVNSMIDGTLHVGEDLNMIFLCCIPKTPDESTHDGGHFKL